MTISLFKSFMWPQKKNFSNFFLHFTSERERDETKINLKVIVMCMHTQIIMIIIINKMLLCRERDLMLSCNYIYVKKMTRESPGRTFSHHHHSPPYNNIYKEIHVYTHTHTLLFFCIKHKQNCEKKMAKIRRMK